MLPADGTGRLGIAQTVQLTTHLFAAVAYSTL
jgi:hypothetical protein